MSIVAIKDNQKLVRDTHSKAVLNTDKAGLQEYYAKRELVKKEMCEKSETKERLAKLESDMQDIKQLLIEIAALRKV
jgi:uncharacterized protein (UPF0276 family)